MAFLRDGGWPRFQDYSYLIVPSIQKQSKGEKVFILNSKSEKSWDNSNFILKK